MATKGIFNRFLLSICLLAPIGKANALSIESTIICKSITGAPLNIEVSFFRNDFSEHFRGTININGKISELHRGSYSLTDDSFSVRYAYRRTEQGDYGYLSAFIDFNSYERGLGYPMKVLSEFYEDDRGTDMGTTNYLRYRRSIRPVFCLKK